MCLHSSPSPSKRVSTEYLPIMTACMHCACCQHSYNQVHSMLGVLPGLASNLDAYEHVWSHCSNNPALGKAALLAALCSPCSQVPCHSLCQLPTVTCQLFVFLHPQMRSL